MTVGVKIMIFGMLNSKIKRTELRVALCCHIVGSGGGKSYVMLWKNAFPVYRITTYDTKLNYLEMHKMHITHFANKHFK